MIPSRIPVSVSKILQAKTKIPLNKIELTDFLSNCTKEERDEVFRVVLKGTMDKPNRRSAQEVLESVTDFKDDEINFFKNHVNRNQNSLNINGFKWFIDKSSNNWLLSKNSVPQDILKKINININHANGNIKSAFFNKIKSLNEKEYNSFLEQHIYNASNEIKSNFINLLFGFGSGKDVDELSVLYPNSVPVGLQADIGFTLLFRKTVYLLNEYKDFAIEAINRHQGKDLNSKGLGRVINGETLAFIYSVYDNLDANSRQDFMMTLISDIFQYKEHGYKDEIVDVVLNENRDCPEKAPKEALIVMLWRIIHSEPKEKRDLFVEKIILAAEEKESTNDIRKIMTDNPDNLEIKINGSKLNINNVTVKDYFQKFLYLILQKELQVKPAGGKKIKI